MQIQNINIMYPNVENMIVVPNHKKIGDYYENPSLTKNFYYKENDENKTFSCQTKASISCIPKRKT